MCILSAAQRRAAPLNSQENLSFLRSEAPAAPLRNKPKRELSRLALRRAPRSGALTLKRRCLFSILSAAQRRLKKIELSPPRSGALTR